MARPLSSWGNSNVQFAVISPEIKELLNKYYSKKMIYDYFTEKGTLTMGYRAFCKAMVKHFPECKGKRTLKPNTAPNAPSLAREPQTAPQPKPTPPITPKPPEGQNAPKPTPPIQRTGPRIVTPPENKPFKVSDNLDIKDVI